MKMKAKSQINVAYMYDDDEDIVFYSNYRTNNKPKKII